MSIKLYTHKTLVVFILGRSQVRLRQRILTPLSWVRIPPSLPIFLDLTKVVIYSIILVYQKEKISFGLVAQLVEHRPEEPSVGGSIPLETTRWNGSSDGRATGF